MERIKLRVSGILALAVVLVVALPAAAAMAKSVLILKSEGTAVPNGYSPSYIGVAVGGCTVLSEGSVTINSAAKDVLVAASAPFAGCESEAESIEGLITGMQLSASGKAKLKGIVKVSKPGPCIYEFKKWKGLFNTSGFVSIEGETSGKLNKKASNPEAGCAESVTSAFAADAADSSLSPFATEL